MCFNSSQSCSLHCSTVPQHSLCSPSLIVSHPPPLLQPLTCRVVVWLKTSMPTEQFWLISDYKGGAGVGLFESTKVKHLPACRKLQKNKLRSNSDTRMHRNGICSTVFLWGLLTLSFLFWGEKAPKVREGRDCMERNVVTGVNDLVCDYVFV